MFVAKTFGSSQIGSDKEEESPVAGGGTLGKRSLDAGHLLGGAFRAASGFPTLCDFKALVKGRLSSWIPAATSAAPGAKDHVRPCVEPAGGRTYCTQPCACPAPWPGCWAPALGARLGLVVTGRK